MLPSNSMPSLAHSHEILNYLTPKRLAIEVRASASSRYYDEGDLIAVATAQEISHALDRDDDWAAVINKHGFLRYVTTPLSKTTVFKVLGRTFSNGQLCAEDNYTVTMVGRTWTHHPGRSAAYADSRGRIYATCPR